MLSRTFPCSSFIPVRRWRTVNDGQGGQCAVLPYHPRQRQGFAAGDKFHPAPCLRFRRAPRGHAYRRHVVFEVRPDQFKFLFSTRVARLAAGVADLRQVGM